MSGIEGGLLNYGPSFLGSEANARKYCEDSTGNDTEIITVIKVLANLDSG